MITIEKGDIESKWNTIWDNISGKVMDIVDVQFRSKVYYQIYDNVQIPVWTQIGDQIVDQVKEQVYDNN